MAEREKRTDDAIEAAVNAWLQVHAWVKIQMEERKMKDIAKALFWVVGAFLLMIFGLVGLILWIISFFVTI